MSPVDENRPSGGSSPVLAVPVVLESKDSEVTRTLTISLGTTIGKLWEEGGFGTAAGLGAHRAWLCLGPAPVVSDEHVRRITLFRASEDPSSASAPELSRAKLPATPAVSSPRLARARNAANSESEDAGGTAKAVVNDVEPFTQEKVSDLDLYSLVELPVDDGMVVAVHLESMKEFVHREFGLCFLAVEAENRYHKALLDLHGDPLTLKGVKFLYFDAAKTGADPKLRKDRHDRAQTAVAFVSPIYFPQKRSRDFLLNFPTAAGVAYPALFGEAFEARVKERSACTGHELAPMLKALFKLDYVRVDEDYELFNTYWKSLSPEERADMQSAPSDYTPPRLGKGKGRSGVWPFGSYQMCTS
ncbi:MAG: hypothetical protein BJ554DRAFT_5803 [Olpidium bornovanus]|uniref:Uncharacterized protein n=1 Tax=Olpidium bornovanus TaxID=278681 RepID=A0A8H8DKR6_9FUNG|nr:MAG: hypothetical protein BJ554DRAFT_5803 [Olpidium bornovanus]